MSERKMKKTIVNNSSEIITMYLNEDINDEND
jgi:hypothetical protein